MCGIAGLLRLNSTPLPRESLPAVKGMTDIMVHRGPDGEGQWLDGPICLGHRRLSIIDLAGGSQPMQDASGRLCIVFNGEIYNFRQLRQELERDGAVFRTDCDTEVILTAYTRWGTDCLNHLDGMFAFALWDMPKQRLFCARDHFGKKPFFYSIQNGLFAFASELNALAALRHNCSFAQFSFNVAPTAIMRYLGYEYVPAPQTIYTEAAALPPAHALIVENGAIQIKRYWTLPTPQPKTLASAQDLCAELRKLLRDAVTKRMVSDVPLGVFLSGGIDSSIVAGLMASQSDRPIQTFSIGFREASYDESSYARIVAKAFKTDHHERTLSADACADALPGIVQAMDTPMADASCAPTWLLSMLARENVTVALGGDGADELWAGYEHYIGYKIALWYNRLPRFIRQCLVEKLAKLLPTSAGYINPRLAVGTFLKGANSPDWLRVQTMLTAMDSAMQREILNEDWLQAHNPEFLNDDTLFAPTKEQYSFWQGEIAPLARAFHVYCRQFLLDDILVKVDRCSMLHSLEVRVPFLDRQAAEFAASLPISCKLHGFSRKYLLKMAFAQLLPPEILNRNKRGFQIPVAAWLRGKLLPLLQDMAAPQRLARQGIFNANAVHRLINEHIKGEKDLRKPLWTFLVLQLWLEGHPACLE